MSFRAFATLILCLATSPFSYAQHSGSSAWEDLVRSNPEVVQDRSVSWRDRLILNVLTPDEARAYFSGHVQASDLVLEDGRTLAEYLQRKLTPPAQVFVPLTGSCEVSALEVFAGSEVKALRVRPLHPASVESAACSVPLSATAALLQAKIKAQAGVDPRIKLWAADSPEPASETGPWSGSDWPSLFETTLLAPLCEGECPEGDSLVRTGGAELSARVLGYFRPLLATDAGGGGISLLTESSNNNFFGDGAGGSNTTGDSNSFFGAAAGGANTTESFNSYFGWNAGASATGSSNTFVGASAGQNNTGDANTFFGRDAGLTNGSGSDNVFFGRSAGTLNTTGGNNTFVGHSAGFANTTGTDNTFLGRSAGFNNTQGTGNAFFGRSSGFSNTTENNNTFFGGLTNGLAGITNATAIGYQAQVSQSNTVVLGSINGVNGAASDVNVGIGTATPQAPLHVQRTGGTAGVLVVDNSATVDRRTLFELRNNGAISFRFLNTGTGANWFFTQDGNDSFGISLSGTGGPELLVRSNGRVQMGPGASTVFDLMPNGDLTISGGLTANGIFYPSDRNLKENIAPVDSASLLEKLASLPIGFWNYRSDPGTRHVGPMAQDFLKAFSIGSDETHINAVDMAGVTLAAVQGLHALVRRQAEELQSQRQRYDAQQQILEALLQRVAELEARR